MTDSHYPKFVKPDYMDEEYVKHCKNKEFQMHIQVDNSWSISGTGFFVYKDSDNVLGLDPVFVVGLLWGTSLMRKGDHFRFYDVCIIPTVEWVKQELSTTGEYNGQLAPIELLQELQVRLGVGDWVER
jgi:hypothetical protein